jgi:signal transduction histidine kinase
VSQSWRSRKLGALALGVLLLTYLSWQLWHWLPGEQELGQAFLPLFDLLGVWAAWEAARRCAPATGLRRFWRLMSAVLAAELIGDLLLLTYDIAYAQPPFPTPADAFFLASYGLLLAALVAVPVANMTRSRRLQLSLDGWTIVLGGAAVVWYFVLGPTALATGEGLLAKGVSMAYPIGDLVLLGGIAVVLLRQSSTALRVPLLFIAAGVLLAVAADVIYGSDVLRGTYTAGDPVDALYALEYSAFTLAALAQPPVPAPAADALEQERRSVQRYRAAAWLPYISLAVGFGVLLGVSLNKAFFPDVSLVLIVIALAGLVAARQYLATSELTKVQSLLRKDIVRRREAERAKEEFISIVGHELRTPLTSIRGSLGLLQAGVMGELPEDGTEMLAVAVTNTDRLVRLVNDVLDVERMDSGQIPLRRAPVAAAELVSESEQALAATAAQARVLVHSDIAATLTVCADSDRIVQTLVNLLGNAIKFSPRGGSVTLTARSRGSCALFCVSDEGRGIPPDQLEAIFERFSQIDISDAREKGGSGLGLAIARGIVEHHGGHLWAQSVLGEGSTFCFTLPLAGAQGSCGDCEPQAGPGWLDPARAGEPMGMDEPVRVREPNEVISDAEHLASVP